MLLNPYRFSSGGGSGPPVDTTIKLLMSFDGDFSEANGLTVTQNNSPVISSSPVKFGSGALDTVNGTAGATAAGLYSRASGDPFTLECWFYITSQPPGGEWQFVNAQGNASIGLYAESSPNNAYYLMRLGSNFIGYQAGAVSIPFNTWTHMRGVWTGGTGYLFINGVLFDSRSLSAAGGSNTDGRVGPVTSSLGAISLYLDEAAVFDRAVTTSAFTPPTSAYPRT